MPKALSPKQKRRMEQHQSMEDSVSNYLKEARENAYRLIQKINHPELIYRKDIGVEFGTV